MPIAIIGSLLICTFLYIIVSGIATGVVPYGQLDVPDPIAVVADRVIFNWMGRVIKFGAVAGLSSVILVMLLGQSRVFYSMSRDGLLPPFVSRVHPRFRTPWLTSIATGIGVDVFAAVFTVREAGSLCSIGTLLAFVIVSIGVLVLRVRGSRAEAALRHPLGLVCRAGRCALRLGAHVGAALADLEASYHLVCHRHSGLFLVRGAPQPVGSADGKRRRLPGPVTRTLWRVRLLGNRFRVRRTHPNLTGKRNFSVSVRQRREC